MLEWMLSRETKSRIWHAFYRMIPKRYYPHMIHDLERLAFVPLDYDKHEILLAEGIRGQTCANEPEVVTWMETYLKPGQVFYDIGANVGAMSLIAAKFHQGKVKVYAFEPAATTVLMLVQNILRNNCEKSVIPVSFPLAKEVKVATFNYFRNLGVGGVGHTFGEAVTYDGDAFEPVYQQLMFSATIDDLVGKGYLPAPNHLKLDVDGLEPEILAGGESVLKSPAVESVILEVGKRFDEKQVITLLDRCEFDIVETYRHENSSNRLFGKRK